jgi:hypothetical protein
VSASTSLTLPVQQGAALGAALTASRADASVHQTVGLTLLVTNSGAAGANVTSVAPTATGTAASCAGPSPTTPIGIPAGTSQAFQWDCTPSAAGIAGFGANVSATDANSGASVSPAVSTTSVTVQTPASPSVAAFDAPATATAGQAFAVTLTVANGGGAAAEVTALNLSDASSILSCAGPPPAPSPAIAIAGGANQVFTWSCTGVAGRTTLQATLTASDANTGADVSPGTIAGPSVTVTP